MTSVLSVVVLDKVLGQTPLACAEAWRKSAEIDTRVPLSYAGRLDPMASGKLLILVGDECKRQEHYHGLDKTYEFSVLLGIGSDTHDVLGRLEVATPELLREAPPLDRATHTTLSDKPNIGETQLVPQLERIASELVGEIELPYPHFSSKTVRGKPLHTWTLESRLDEISIPTKSSIIYNLELTGLEWKDRQDVAREAREKIDTIPPVTDPRKSLGNDFRRVDVRSDWERISRNEISKNPLPDTYPIAHFTCTASSGTYMRSLAKIIGERLTPPAPSLAWSIHRTHIGTFDPATSTWTKLFN